MSALPEPHFNRADNIYELTPEQWRIVRELARDPTPEECGEYCTILTRLRRGEPKQGFPQQKLDNALRQAVRAMKAARQHRMERVEHELSFELRWQADMRAIARWQAAHPGNDLVWPDHTDLLVWLLDQVERKETVREES